MNFLALFGDAMIITAGTLGASLKRGLKPFRGERSTYVIYGITIFYTVISVYLRYRGQENSDYFFWHPYFAWSVANLVYIILYNKIIDTKRLILERIVLWQLVVIPIFSGVALTVGWLMKLYVRY